MEYEVEEVIEKPILSLKHMAEGDSIVIKFTGHREEKQINDHVATVCDVVDVEDGCLKSMVLPRIVRDNIEKIGDSLIRLTKGEKKNRCVMWKIEKVREVKGKGKK